MKIKKIIATTLAATFAASIALTGCGNNTANAETTVVTEATAPETTVQGTEETTVPELAEMTDDEIEALKKNGSLVGIGDYAILKDSTFKIADNVKFKKTALKAIEITDKDVDLKKVGEYEAKAKLTIKEGVDKSRTLKVTVYDKDEMTEELANAGVISGVSDITVQEGTEVKAKDLIFVNADIVTLINVDETKVDMAKAGEYKYTVTYAVDTEKAKELEDKINAEIDENAKKAAENGNEAVQEHVDFHIPENCDYAALTKEFTAKVVTSEKAAAANNGPYAAVVTPENKDQAIEENRNAVGESVKGVDEINTEDETTEAATTVPETTTPQATTETQPAPTQGAPQDGSNDRPAEQNTEPAPAETGRSGDSQPAAPFVPDEPQTTAHTHTWVEITTEEPVYETVHHDAVTEQVWVVDEAAWDETIEEYVWKIECSDCGMVFDNTNAGYEQLIDHQIEAGHDGERDIQVATGSSTIHHDEVGHYETKTISEAYDEQVQTGTKTVVTGYKCSVCGETK